LLRHAHAAAVLLFDPETDQVVLIEQMRPAVLTDPNEPHPWVLDIVAGMVDPHESVADAAKREAFEEAGIRVITLVPIVTYWPSVGISNEQSTVYCGRVKAPMNSSLQGLASESEDIKVHIISTEQAFQFMAEGSIKTASAVIALQWLKLNHLRLLKEWI